MKLFPALSLAASFLFFFWGKVQSSNQWNNSHNTTVTKERRTSPDADVQK
jgi:hypothetical protein